ncbi:MAG: RHS repeat domain-containing protein [Thermodesulfovibrionales bacterium]|nr:RHS repeat domain-containing protein [Thermodesulfovibrionales bacterium]
MLKSKKRFCLPFVQGLAVLLFSLVLISTVSAENTNYFYDNLGRVIKAVSETGAAATYNYDAVGNLLSVSTQTTKPLPPVLNSVTPDIVFAGATMTIAIRGANLFTTESVWSGNGIIINSFTSSDTVITANITLPYDMPLGTTTVNVKTLYGSASINLDVYNLTLEPATKYLLAGETVIITAGITPSISRDLNLSINNKNPDVIEASQSVAIPSGGNGTFTVRALSQGTGIVDIGGVIGTIFVTPSLSGDVSTSGAPISVYIESSSVDAATISAPVSAYMEPSISVDAVESGAPVSVYKEEPLSVDAVESGGPVSVYKEEPLSVDATAITAPVSAEISSQ